MKLEYTIPKINGKELTAEQIAILFGYEKMVESQPKTVKALGQDEIEAFAAQTLTLVVNGDGTMTYTELVNNPMDAETFIKVGFQKIIKDLLLEKLKDRDITDVIDNLK